jgi:hypothetical protein
MGALLKGEGWRRLASRAALQIYGADPERLVEAARLAEAAGAAFIDINCGCWVPSIARRGAGAGWLRDPEAMVGYLAGYLREVEGGAALRAHLNHSERLDDWLERIAALEAQKPARD